jgi:hypothetical protein
MVMVAVEAMVVVTAAEGATVAAAADVVAAEATKAQKIFRSNSPKMPAGPLGHLPSDDIVN